MPVVLVSSDGVVGFGLDGDEARAPAHLFTEAFKIVRSTGLLAVPHAGELTGAHAVQEALDLLSADRIMHGVRAIDDAQLPIAWPHTKPRWTSARPAT